MYTLCTYSQLSNSWNIQNLLFSLKIYVHLLTYISIAMCSKSFKNIKQHSKKRSKYGTTKTKGSCNGCGIRLRISLDKDSTKSPWINLKQIGPWIGPFFTPLFFSMVPWVCLKDWGPIQGSNIKNMWLTCEKFELTFRLFLFFLWFFFLKIIHNTDFFSTFSLF